MSSLTTEDMSYINKRPDFDKIKVIFQAIKDIDRMFQSPDTSKMENVLEAIKDIPKSDFDIGVQLSVARDIKNGLVDMLDAEMQKVKDSIKSSSGTLDEAVRDYQTSEIIKNSSKEGA